MGNLSDVQIRAWIKAGERFEGCADGDGLYLRFRKTDAVPAWRFRYRFDGRQRVVSLGSYTTLSLAEARRTAKEFSAEWRWAMTWPTRSRYRYASAWPLPTSIPATCNSVR
jgi:hypothetical protein